MLLVKASWVLNGRGGLGSEYCSVGLIRVNQDKTCIELSARMGGMACRAGIVWKLRGNG